MSKGTVHPQLSKNQLKEEPAVKYDRMSDGSHKNRYDLLPAEAIDDVVKIYTYGAIKYPSPRNWELGMSWSRVFGALMRHAWAFWRGEEKDQESGLPHMAHAAWCCLALLQFMRNKRSFDDRPSKQTESTTSSDKPTTYTCTVTKTPADEIPRHNGRIILACPKCGKVYSNNTGDSFMIGTGFIKCKLCDHKVTAGRRDAAVIRWNEESRAKWKTQG